MVVERDMQVGALADRVYAPASGTPKGAVVFVHGVCTSGAIWSNWAAAFAQRGFEAHCVDLRGHGKSDGRDAAGGVRFDDHVLDVEALLEATGASAVVGHDVGGLIGQALAARRELRGLVLVNSMSPKGVGGQSVLSLLWRELRPRYVRAILRGHAWRPADGDVTHLLCGKLPPDESERLLASLEPESGVMARELVLSGVGVDEGQVRCPVFVVASTFDRLTPPARQRLLAARYRGDYVEFAQHAHFPMLEPGWARPAAVIGKWLEEAARIGDGLRGSASRIRASGRRPVVPYAAPSGSQPSAPERAESAEPPVDVPPKRAELPSGLPPPFAPPPSSAPASSTAPPFPFAPTSSTRAGRSGGDSARARGAKRPGPYPGHRTSGSGLAPGWARC
jgi:pimeloyl-ACP methyl ester carboxylesterase